MSSAAGGEAGFGRIRITEKAIEEVVDRTALVSIPRADVQRVVLRRGIAAEHPAFFVALGLAFCALGAYAAVNLLAGHLLLARTSTTLAFGLLAGPLLILAGLRRGFVLEIETRRGTRKLGLGKDRELDIARLDDFVAAAARAGVTIERG